jgi:hypothetical protein
LTVGKIEILDAQAHDLHQAKAAAVHDLCHELIKTIHLSDDFFRFLPREHGGDALWPGRADGNQGLFVQLDAEDIAVEEENGADGLVLCGGGDCLLIDEMSNEVVDLDYAHLARMALVVVEDVLADPADIGLFGAEGIVAVPKELAVLVKQFFGFPRSWDIRWRRGCDVWHVGLMLADY